MKCYKRSLLFIQLLYGYLLTGCGKVDYCQFPATDSETAPVIIAVDDVETQQKEAILAMNELGVDPWLAVMKLSFSDSDGDLAAGKLRVAVNGSETYNIELEPLFKQHAIPMNSMAAELPVLFRILLKNLPSAGASATLNLGFSLIDGAGQVSNCESVQLDIRVN